MKLKETEAIILRSFKLAEADKIVVCLTKNSGVIRGVAKGARRLKSRFGASLEPFTLTNILYIEKEGRELVNIRQAEILRSHFKLAKIEEAVSALEYLGELVIEFAPPHLTDERFFRLVRTCAASIEAEPDKLQPFVGYFEIWALKLSGFLPDFRVCGRCGKNLRNGPGTKIFKAHDNTPRCSTCVGQGDRPLDTGVHDLLCSAQLQGPETWASLYMQCPTNTRQGFISFTRALIEEHLERTPRGLQNFSANPTSG